MRSLLFLFVLTFSIVLQAQQQKSTTDEFYPDRVIVKFKGDKKSNKIQQFRNELSAELNVIKSKTINLVDAEVWDLDGQEILSVVEKWKTDPRIQYIQPDYYFNPTPLAVPNDPSYGLQWDMDKIQAPDAWDINTGNDIIVAIFDSGVDADHEDLAANMWTNPGETPGNNIDDDNNGIIDDVHGYNAAFNTGDIEDGTGHGTRCAGIIGAVGNNSVGVAGVNWNVKIMSIKVFDGATESQIADAYGYAVTMGAKVTNHSYIFPDYSQVLYDAVQAAGNAGVLFVAGNSNSSGQSGVNYPAFFDLDNIISVTSTDENDDLARSYDATFIDLGAPGENIYTTTSGNGYNSGSGTSYATPHVTGAAALIWSQYPGLTNAEVKAKILDNVDPLASLAGKTVTGGRLNLFNALANICPGNISLNSQAAVNAFTCNEVTGILTIQGADITDLSPLSSLSLVGGSLYIQNNTALTNLDGLSSLASVGDSVLIINNTVLTNLDSLSSLASVGGVFLVSNNAVLSEFCGLYHLLNDGVISGFFAAFGNASNPTQQDIIDGGPCVECPEPSDLMASNITAASADLSWTENGSSTSWQIRLGLTGFDTTGVLPEVTASNPYPATGLNPDTNYDFYVRSVCDGSEFSGWVGPYTFETSCAPPIAVCQNITVYLDGAGNATISPADVDAGSSADCGLASSSVFPAFFNCDDIGANTAVFQVTDVYGATDTCHAIVTVADTTSPNAVCQNVWLYLDAAGNATITPGDLNGGSTDNCGIPTLSASQTLFTCADIGANNVTLTATDGSGNQSSCVSVVTVADTTSPVAVCKNIEAFLDGNGFAVISGGDIDGGSTDNCGIASLSVSPNLFTCSDLGPQNVTLTVTDESGNSAECIAEVIVRDNIPPQINCVAPALVSNDPGQCGAYIVVPVPSTFDNCSVQTLTNDYNNTSNASDFYPVGNTYVEWTVNDQSGNSDNCVYLVRVIDAESPTIDCPADITVNIDPTLTGSVVNFNTLFSDNCPGATLECVPPSGSFFNTGTTAVSCTVTDAAGNPASCSFSVTVTPEIELVYADDDATGLNNGTSWDDAFNDLQDALTLAETNPFVTQIWVAAGTYYPDQGNGYTDNDRTHSFVMQNNLAIYGGFEGTEDPLTFNLADRAFATNETILSGDLLGDDGPDFANYGDNSYTVIFSGTGTDATAILDGFTVTGGSADDNSFGITPVTNGGGMFNEMNASPSITNCSFNNNYANWAGAMLIGEGSNPILNNCTFSHNTAKGGGAISSYLSTSTLTDCIFEGNSATDGIGLTFGGAVRVVGSESSSTSLKFIRCNFIENTAFGGGGAINSSGGNSDDFPMTFDNCTFTQNICYDGSNYGTGGAFQQSDAAAQAVFTNCLFDGNKALGDIDDGGGAIMIYGGLITLINSTIVNSESAAQGAAVSIGSNTGSLIIKNSILWNNTAVNDNLISNFWGGLANIEYSLLQDACPPNVNCGDGMIYNMDPLFADANDFHLQACSPAINTGDNTAVPAGITTDLDGNPRFYDSGTVDMGAYEYQGDFAPCCANPSDGGTIADNQTICFGTTPNSLTSSALPSGHTGTIEYKWQQSTTNVSSGFSDISSSNSAEYSPGSLTATTWYKRLARVECETDWTGAVESNVVQVDVNPLPIAIISNIIDNFEDGLPTGIDGVGNDIGFITWGDFWSGTTVAITTTSVPDTDPLALPGQSGNNQLLKFEANVIGWGGLTHAFENEDVDTWVTQDWSSYEGIAFWLFGQNTGNELLFEIHDNRNPGSTISDTEIWSHAFVDDFSGWRLFVLNFDDDFIRKDIGNGAPNDGFGRDEVHGLAFATLTTGGASVTYYLDNVMVYGNTGSVTICETGSHQVSGANAAHGTILWTHDGTGTLLDETTLTPTYNAAAGDAGKTVTLTMTVTGNNVCVTSTATAAANITINPTRLYVTESGAGIMDGSSWVNAIDGNQLQTAINAQCVTEIWVAAGTYYPDEGIGYTDNNRSHSFVMKNNLAIYGGFDGTEDPLTFDLNDRDFVANETILSGDIDQNDGPDFVNNEGNSYHVVSNDGNGLDNTAIIDGFTISGGNADGTNPANFGGGMQNIGSSPLVSNCVFMANSATYSGGGMSNYGSSPLVINCVFAGNSSSSYGGGMENDNNCSTVVINCSFSGNSAGNSGGAMDNYINSNTTIINSIFWGNSTEIQATNNSFPIIKNSIIQGGCPANATCTDVLDMDPLFVDQPAIGLGSTGDLRLQECSPGIDAGDNTALPADVSTDLDGNPRFYNSGIVDMGAYEYQGDFASCCPANNTLTVNNLGDEPDANPGDGVCATAGGACTLRAAFMEANELTGCSPLLIDFSVSGNIELATALPEINHPNLTIDGPGADQLTVQRSTADGTPDFRIFTIPGGKTVEIIGLTITNGSGGAGSGISNRGILSLDNMVITENYADQSSGGGIYNVGQLTIDHTTISNNTAGSDAGILTAFGSVTISNSIFSGNVSVGQSSAIKNQDAIVTMTNCAFFGNSTGGIINLAINQNSSSITLTNCSVADENIFAYGNSGAVSSQIKLQNCILFNAPLSAGGVNPSIVSLGNNLSNSNGQGFLTGAGDILNMDPLFVSSTDLHLQNCSPAIDAGNDAANTEPFDLDGNQRKFEAISGGSVIDMGAYERQTMTYDGEILYVNDDANGANTGFSWDDAYTDLQSALSAACPNVTQIWVAKGTYFPTTDTNRSVAFVLKNNLSIFGGFAGTEDPLTFDLNDRDFMANETILSGDIDQNDGPDFVNNEGNSYHVVSNDGNGLDNTAIIDGFTISGGNANGDNPSTNVGGGMRNFSTSPKVVNCIFEGNAALYAGGGMHNIFASPHVVSCLFLGNVSSQYGGGLECEQSSNATIINCSFSGNSAGIAGGAIDIYDNSNPEIVNSIFWGNNSEISISVNSFPTINNSIVDGGCPTDASCTDVLDVDPRFIDQPAIGLGSTGDLRLQDCSPAINTGDNTAVPVGITTDLDGNPRIYDNGIVDMGAYEYQGEKPTNPTDGGEIAANQNICSGDIPDPFTSVSPATGFVGDLEYQWQSSSTNASSGFADIVGANAVDYQAGMLTQTTWLRRLAKVACETEWVESNVVQVVVNPLPIATISGDTGPFCPYNTIQFSAPAGMATYSWNIDGGALIGSWDDNIGFTPGPADEQDVQVVGGCGISFTLTLTVVDNQGCSASTQQTYVVEESDVAWVNEPQDHIVACDVNDIETEVLNWLNSFNVSSNCFTENADYYLQLLQVNSPGNILGGYYSKAALFGPSEFNITGDLTMADPALACDPLQNDLTGKIAVIDRGACNFTVKVKHAQDAGATGVIVVNSIVGAGLFTMAGTDPTITIPSLFISYEDGQILKQAMQQELVNVTLNSFIGVQVGDYPVLFRAVNTCGQLIEKTVTLSITDTTSPTAVCQNITVYLDETGSATIIASDLDGGSTDNCGSVDFSASQTSFTCADIGANNVSLTVFDGNGNQSDCVSVVTVTDTITPDPGSISGATDIDFGSSTGDLILSGNYGEVKKWQKRFGITGAWTDIAHTGQIYSEVPSSLGTWQYRALVQGSACAEAFTEPHSVTVGTKELTIDGTFTANDKIYDDNTDATFDQNNLTLEGIVGTEDVMLTGLEIDFESKEVGNHTVSITNASLAGLDKDNYTLSLTGAPETNADILPGSPDHFLVTDPDGNDISSPKLVNIPFDAKVTLVDAFDNPTPNTGGDVTVTLTGSGGATPGDLRFQGFPADPVTQTLNADESSVDFNSILYTGVSDIPGMDVKIDAGASGAGSADGMTGESNLFSVREIFFTVEASPTTLPADGTSKSDITVTLLDFENNPIADQEITVENDFGTLMEGVTELPALVSRTTDANGQVLLELRADTESAVATVTAKCPGACPHSVEVAFTINAPNITGFTPGENQASVEFNPPTNPGTTTITNYEYSLNDGTDWDPFNPEQDASPVTVSGLTEYQTYPVKLRAINEAGSGAASNSFEIFACANPTDGGAIAADQNLFEGDTPALLTNETDASGEYGDLEYKWQLSTTSATEAFTDIPAATGATYQPEATFETTWFRRLARVSCKADWTGAAQSNVVQVYIYQPPTVEITSPTDGSTTYDATITVSGTASDADNDLASVYARINGGGWQPATGTSNWQTDLPVVFGNNLIEAKSVDAQGLESDLDAVPIFAGVQEIAFGEGWNHISAYLTPLDPDLETILQDPVNANLITILNDMHGGIYWPSQNLNTIGQWNSQEAYQAKLTGASAMLFSGELLDDQTLDLESGFTYLPVLTNVSSPIDEVFENPMDDVKLIFNHQTVQIYWPYGGIFTLEELQPGMGYLAIMNNAATATFPPYDMDAMQTKASGISQPEDGPWPLVRTNQVHMISVSVEAMAELSAGTYIGAFDENGRCIGYTEIDTSEENSLLVVYGDESYTQPKDGALEGEIIYFRSWNADTGDESNLIPVFSDMMPNVDGRFANNGLSMITDFKANSTGIGEGLTRISVQLFPNPARESVTLVCPDYTNEGQFEAEFVNANGELIVKIPLKGQSTRISLDRFTRGVYFVKITSQTATLIEKLVIQ